MLLSGDGSGGRYGNMTREHWRAFFEDMVAAGTLPPDLAWEDAFDLRFVQAIYGE